MSWASLGARCAWWLVAAGQVLLLPNARALNESNVTLSAYAAADGCAAFAKSPAAMASGLKRDVPTTSYTADEPGAGNAPLRSNWSSGNLNAVELQRYLMGRRACELFRQAKGDELFYVERVNQWFKRSDFLAYEELPRIQRWNTRFIYRRTSLSGAGSELNAPASAVSAEQSRNAYSVGAVADGLFYFSPDGRWLDQQRQKQWEMRIAPSGMLYIRDLAGELGEEEAIFHRAYRPRCETDHEGRFSCGLYYMMRTDLCAEIKDLAQAPEHLRRYCSPEAIADAEDRVGRVVFEDLGYYPNAIKLEGGRLVIYQRFGQDQKNPNLRFLSLTARFGDPIRPVVFAPGVLFQDQPVHGSMRAGKGGLYPRPFCLADCPEQLKAQGISP